MDTDEAVKSFVASLQGFRSQNTVDWYNYHLSHFAKHFPSKDIRTLTITDLRGYRAYVATRNALPKHHQTKEIKKHLSPYTVHSSVKCVRRFFKWLYDEGVITQNPALRLEVPPLPKETREGISDEDADKMIKASRGTTRDYAILLFVRDTGARLGGVTDLKLSSLNFKSRDPHIKNRVKITEKGEQDRYVYMEDATVRAMEAWLEARPEWASHDFVFCTHHGAPLTEMGVYEIFRRIARQAGVKSNWSPHQWRHRFARRLLNRGANLQQVSQMMGHASITVTSRYYGKLAQGDVQDAYYRYHDEEDLDAGDIEDDLDDMDVE